MAGQEGNHMKAITFIDPDTPISTREDQVEELRKWKILEEVSADLLRQVRYAMVAPTIFVSDYALMTTFDDKAWVIGDNQWWQLGVDKSVIYVDRAAENKLLSGLGIIGFCTGWFHVSAWTKDGKLYMMGRNRGGELGQGHENDMKGPQQVLKEMNVEVLKAACGAFHTLCVTTEGNVFAWGLNVYRQCSAASVSAVTAPTQIKFPTGNVKIVDVACTWNSSFALTADGHLYGWGDNQYGQVGIGSTDKIVRSPKKISIPNDERVKNVSCGTWHCMALTTTGTLFVWGGNNDGELGTESRTSSNRPVKIDIPNVVSISAITGDCSSVCETSDGNIYAWGEIVDSARPKLSKFTTIDNFRAHYQLGTRETWISKYHSASIEPDCHTFLTNYINLKKITIQVEGKKITASKVYLRRCIFFQDKLKNEWKKASKTCGVIEITGFQAKHFQIFIDFLQTDCLEAVVVEDLIELFKLAYFYKMERFQVAIYDLVSEALTVDNALQFYSVALEHHDKALKSKVLSFIKPRASEIMDKMDLSQATVVKLLKDIQALGAFKSK